MPFQEGNQLQVPSNSKLGSRLLTKTRSALDKAIDGLGSAEKNGATAMAELITAALKDDVIGTLKALAPYMPKELQIDVQHSTSALQLTDDQLLEIIKSRAIPAEKQIPGEIIEAETVKINQENSDNQLESEQVVTECTDDHL